MVQARRFYGRYFDTDNTMAKVEFVSSGNGPGGGILPYNQFCMTSNIKNINTAVKQSRSCGDYAGQKTTEPDGSRIVTLGEFTYTFPKYARHNFRVLSGEQRAMHVTHTFPNAADSQIVEQFIKAANPKKCYAKLFVDKIPDENNTHTNDRNNYSPSSETPLEFITTTRQPCVSNASRQYGLGYQQGKVLFPMSNTVGDIRADIELYRAVQKQLENKISAQPNDQNLEELRHAKIKLVNTNFFRF